MVPGGLGVRQALVHLLPVVPQVLEILGALAHPGVPEDPSALEALRMQ